jgi:hypothetical protein
MELNRPLATGRDASAAFGSGRLTLEGWRVDRRDFLGAGVAVALSAVSDARAEGLESPDAWLPRAFHAAPCYLRTEFGRIAYVERGGGPAALFRHGWPLNGTR